MRTEERKFSEEEMKRLVGKVEFIKCNICRNNYFPTSTDVSLNGNFYYKNCNNCRKRRTEMKKKSLNKQV